MGAGAKSPSSLAPFACDWVGGDIHGLSAYAGTLYRYVPEISGVTSALNSKVSQVVTAAGWQGPAAAAFTQAWERDSAAATALALVASACGDVVNTLAVNLAKIENALEMAADQVAAHGVSVGAGGQPPQLCLAGPAESWRASYQSFWNQCMLAAATARAQAAGALQGLYAQMTRGPGNKGLGGGEYAALFDTLAGFWGAQTRYSKYVDGKIAGLKQAVSQAIANAREEARLANGQFGPWTDQGRAGFGDAKTQLASVETQLADARSAENLFSKVWGFSASDIPAAANALNGLDGAAGGLAKFAADIPFVDIAAAGASTYFGAQQDIQAGVPWQVAYPGEAAGSIAAIGTGAVVGNLAVGGAAAGLGALGAGGLGVSLAAGGAGVLAGGVVAYGVGDFAHNLIGENWGADISQHGVVAGIGAGIADSAVKTGQDFAHVGESIWHGFTSLF